MVLVMSYIVYIIKVIKSKRLSELRTYSYTFTILDPIYSYARHVSGGMRAMRMVTYT